MHGGVAVRSCVALVMLAGCATSHLTLGRTQCFGDCPVYQLEVWRDGRVIRRDMNGEKISSIDPVQYAQLEQEARRQLAQPSEGKCPVFIYDVPGVSVALTDGAGTRTMAEAYACPDSQRSFELWELARTIDEVTGVAKHHPLQDRGIDVPVDGVLALYQRRMFDGLREVLVCQNGVAQLTLGQLHYVGRFGVQLKLSAEELADVSRAVASHPRGTRLFAEPGVGLSLATPKEPLQPVEAVPALDKLFDDVWSRSQKVVLAPRRYRNDHLGFRSSSSAPKALSEVELPMSAWLALLPELTRKLQQNLRALPDGRVLDVLVGLEKPNGLCESGL